MYRGGFAMIFIRGRSVSSGRAVSSATRKSPISTTKITRLLFIQT